MSHRSLIGLLFLSLSSSWLHAEDPVFSGPQVGEKLPSFKAQGVSGDLEGKEFDFIADAKGKPVILFFFHERTRPAFGMARELTSYTTRKVKNGLHTCVVFLTDDPTATMKWTRGILKYFPEDLLIGISPDGKEGPGAYGLNRNVTLTVLVGKEGKVTGNFALVQPSLQADGQKILNAVAEAIDEEPVTIKELLSKREGMAQRMQGAERRARAQRAAAAEREAVPQDPQLPRLLRPMLNKEATTEKVKELAAKIEKYVEENEVARKDLVARATRIVESGKLSNYGTEAAQEVIRGWVKKYTKGSDSKERSQEKSRSQ